MKKIFKWGLILAFGGLILLIFGLVGHGNQSVYFEGAKPVLNSEQKRYAKTYQVKNPQQLNFLLNQTYMGKKCFAKISLEIRTGAKFSVKYVGDRKDAPVIKEKDGVLTVYATQGDKPKSNVNFTWNDRQMHVDENRLIVTVPDKASYQKVHLEGINADLNAKGITTAKLEMMACDADADFQKVTAKQLTLKSSESDLKMVNSTLENGTIILGDGDLKTINSQLKQVSIKTSEGDLTLNNSGLTACNLKADEGDITANQLDVKGKSSLTSQTGDITVVSGQIQGYVLQNGVGDNQFQGQKVARKFNKKANLADILYVTDDMGDINIQ
ncbi:Putative adhesin [Ligilactobacillus sp. WC1T17]|uniref:Adhesin n=1 Tax=Ligilactobacillus ruminis TaxID=1623 RepID=A0ABY1A987_9LACO|nr:Putative adhesin [Ligilactobacillus ruminis]